MTAFDSGLALMVYPGRSQPETLVRTRNGIKGFDAAFQLEKRFPPSSPVSVTAVILASRRGSRLSLEGR